jgi:branched-chain amino acid transport system permease protein
MSENQKKRRIVLNSDDYRLLSTCVAGGLLLALMTGPEGDISTPLAAAKASLISNRIWGFILFGLIIGALSVWRRKRRNGEIVSVREVPRRSLKETVSDTISSMGYGAWAVIAVIGILAALLIADFTGPLVVNKFSFGQIFGQLKFTRTYGYIVMMLWIINSFRVSKSLVTKAAALPSFAKSPVFRIVAGAVGGFFFALCADPWLPERFNFSYFTTSGNSTTAFLAHLPTWLWTGAGVLLGLRGVMQERKAVKTVSRVRPRYIPLGSNTTIALYTIGLFAAFEAPKYLSPFWQEAIFQQVGIFCFLAIGLNIVVGFAGLLDLGYVAFYALGAYVNAYFSGALPIHPPFILNPFVSIPVSIVVAMTAGVLLGLPTLRLRGDYLAIVTLGFGEIIYVLANNLQNVTSGAGGTGYLQDFAVNVPGLHLALNGQAISQDLDFYYLLLAFLIPILFLFTSLNNSKVGRSWAAIREDEVAAASLGINGLKYKVMAFAIGASTSGVAGVLSSEKLGLLFPSDFALQVSITVLVLVIFGGMGSISGVLIGSAVIGWLLQFLIFHSFIGYQDADKYMWIGALLILTMIFRPQGLWPSKRREREIYDAEVGLGSSDSMGTVTGAGEGVK